MLNFILIALYFVLTLVWCFLLLTGSRRYREYIKPLDSKKYMLKSLYPVGFQILDFIGYSYTKPSVKKKITQAKTVFGERFGEYYYRVNMAEKMTYVAMFVVISPILGPMMGNPLFSLFGLFAALVMYKYADTKITDIVDKREDELSRDFADMVSKMALLINAGMITREAWEAIADTGEGALYDEMKSAVVDMHNGMSEVDAYISFGNRCNVDYIKKFISMLAQNLTKGNRELVAFLTVESANSWEEKKHYVKRKGEAASSKLMLPLGMMLIGIFIMILVPVLGNMGI